MEAYERDLADSSEAFLAASVLVGLKAEVLEASTFLQKPNSKKRLMPITAIKAGSIQF